MEWSHASGGRRRWCFLWEGTSYDSLSKVAFAITGTRWNGPLFFGLRDAAGNGDEP
ncbi:MAG: DUF2924 domain-containing protein [Xanthobacteraceae bacterium]